MRIAVTNLDLFIFALIPTFDSKTFMKMTAQSIMTGPIFLRFPIYPLKRCF